MHLALQLIYLLFTGALNLEASSEMVSAVTEPVRKRNREKRQPTSKKPGGLEDYLKKLQEGCLREFRLC